MKIRAAQRLMAATLLAGLGAGCQASRPPEPTTEVTGEAAQELAFLISCPQGVPTPPAPDLSIDKTVVAHGAPCPGVDPFVTPLGSQVDYCLAITNNSAQSVRDITVVDDNGTFNYTVLTHLLIAAGLTDANGDGKADLLSAGQSVSIKYGPINFADPDGQLVTNDIVRVSFTFSANSTASCLAYYTDASTVIDGPACVQDPGLCNDGSACTADACDPDIGCTHSAVSCNDGNACTTDACDAAAGCTHAPVVCNDGNACTAETCDAFLGCSHQAVVCDDGDACTADACDPVAGCSATSISCEDNNACTAESCDPVAGCGHDTVSCDDGNACTADSCDALTGCAHAAITCDDGNYTTTDSCDPGIGCVNDPISCDDANPCTTDSINLDGTCDHALLSCDDGNACTTDTCDPASGCVNAAVSCDDGDACTADSCSPASGCAHAAISCGTGATRTIGYYATHPAMISQCLAALGGTIDLGFVQLRNEIADNDVDVDIDNRVETGLLLSLGMLKAKIPKLSNGQQRTALNKARMQAGQQMVAAICNNALTGAVPSFNLNAAVATLAGSDVAAILAVNNAADAFNNSKDNVSLGLDGGPANPKAAYDDPTDPND